MIRIGHRGAAGYEPENTLLSFSKAIEIGVDMIELDVQSCASGEIVVMHDLKVDRTTDGKGYVSSLSIDGIKRLHAGKDQTIPTLSETLDFIKGRVGVNVEIKERGISARVYDILNEFIEGGIYREQDFLVSSFDQIELYNFTKVNDNIPIGVLLSGIPFSFPRCLEELNAQAANLNVEFINSEMVSIVHSLGKNVNVWTTDDPDDIARVKVMGVDGIISNFPDRIR
ncbi:MAG: glycerophosphodiester phosphodiesterase [Proteobacteria bacterium]|nr:glycerophosphodiester phosphodiesterase [Pseudomonadota bacterium]